MAKHAPPTLATGSFPIMAEPLLGAEFQSFITSKVPAEMGLFTITGASAGSFEADTVGAAQLLASPQSLIVVVDEAITDAGANIVLTIAGVAEDASNITGTATITTPGYLQNQNKTFPRGFAVDVVVTGDKKFKSINNGGITVVCNALATNARIRVMGIPEITDFERVGCTGAGSFQPRVRRDAPIRCGSDPSAFVKEGDLAEGSLRIEAKYFNYGAGLARYAGQRCMVLLKEMRTGAKIPTTYHYVTQYVPTGEITIPEGSEPCMNTSESRFQVNMTFLAPTAAIAIIFGLLSSFGQIYTDLGPLLA